MFVSTMCTRPAHFACSDAPAGVEERQTVMRKEREQRFVERWPTWFHIDGDTSQTLMSFGFEHGDGWFDIVWRLCEGLEPLVAEVEVKTGHPFEVLQVKEKLGGLRFWANQKTDAISKRIEAAELESLCTCEVCGQPGARRTEHGRIRTVCGICPVRGR